MRRPKRLLDPEPGARATASAARPLARLHRRRCVPVMLIALAAGVSIAAAARADHQVSRDPTGAPPTHYSAFQRALPPSAPLDLNPLARGDRRGMRPGGRVLLLVNNTLYASIATEINRLWLDLETAGYAVALTTTSGGTPASLRAYLQSEYGGAGLAGALLIGDLPVPWYEIDFDFDGADADTLDDEYADFPCDLFYMDLDGSWQDLQTSAPFQYGVYDSHTDGGGDRLPEIWVGRLTASPLTLSGESEATLVANYLDKDHALRSGPLCPVERALVYVDDDWYDVADSVDLNVAQAYAARVLVKDKATTCRNDYRDLRLAAGYEFMQVMLHSNWTEHFFKVDDAWEMDGGSLATVTNHDVENADPVALFYNLYTCSGCRYVESDYIGAWYLFVPNHGLGAVGTTKIGGMWDYETFYAHLGQGLSLGAAFQQWLAAQAPYDADAIRWYYGMTLLGDGALALRPQVLAHAPARLVPAAFPQTSVTVTCDRDMLAGDAHASSFPVRGSVSGRMNGSYSYDSGTRTFRFSPAGSFLAGEVVTPVFSRAIASAANIPSRGCIWSFTTGIGNPTAATFLDGGNCGIMNADHLCSGDFNGDGYPDLAVVGYSPTDFLKVALNAGDGTFLSPTTYTTGQDPRWVAAGDFDGDGDLDLAVANTLSSAIGIYRNLGSGTFTGPVNYGSPNYPGALIAGDYDADGDLDLAVLGGSSQQHFLATYANDGSGIFDYQLQQLPWGTYSLRLQQAADWEGDGDLDLLAARATGYGEPGDSLAVLGNDGMMRFTLSCLAPVADGACGVASHDFNGDGYRDAAVTSVYTQTLTVLCGNAAGAIGSSQAYDLGGSNSFTIRSGDFDGDGDIDLAAGIHYPLPGTVRLLKNDGAGGFADASDAGSWGPYALTDADFDRDGDLDLALAYNNVPLLTNDGSADVTPPARVADLSGFSSPARSNAMMSWTAPGDDGRLGRASTYDLRYSTAPVATDTLAWWSAALEAAGEPDPSFAGMSDSCALSGLDPDATYYLILRTADEAPNWSGYSNVCTLPPASSDATPAAPEAIRLAPPCPVPCHLSAQITFELPAPAPTRLEIYDAGGRLVRHMVPAGVSPAGRHAWQWDLRDQDGRMVPSGLFFCRLRVGEQERHQRILVTR